MVDQNDPAGDDFRVLTGKEAEAAHRDLDPSLRAKLDDSIAEAQRGQAIPLDVFEAEHARRLENPSSVSEWDADMCAGRCPLCHQEVTDDRHRTHHEQYFVEARSRLGLPAQP